MRQGCGRLVVIFVALLMSVVMTCFWKAGIDGGGIVVYI